MGPQPAAAVPSAGQAPPFSYGDYFEAVQRFLAHDRCRRLLSALKQHLGKALEADRIRRIDVFLVKHGEFYHPARIEVDTGVQRLNFVLNVAVSEPGRACLDEEYRSLTRLARHKAAGFIPRVYGRGRVRATAGFTLGMWLGEWFEGFHEFHWSKDETGNRLVLAVWDPQTGKRCLSVQQAAAVYHRAAAILTRFYDLSTFEQVHPWHHAAGDFVIRQDHGRLEARLITVRGYRSLLNTPAQQADPPPDANLTLQVLLLFLVRLSLRMRLDRLDGVGERVWAAEAIVRQTVAGFRAALAEKSQPVQLPDAPLKCFDFFISQCSEADLLEITTAVVTAYRPGHPERPLLLRKMPAHAAQLFKALSGSLGTGSEGIPTTRVKTTT